MQRNLIFAICAFGLSVYFLQQNDVGFVRLDITRNVFRKIALLYIVAHHAESRCGTLLGNRIWGISSGCGEQQKVPDKAND